MAKRRTIKRKTEQTPPSSSRQEIDPNQLLSELEESPSLNLLENDTESKKPQSNTPLPLPQSLDEDLKEIILSLSDNEFDSGVVKMMLIQSLRNNTKLQESFKQLTELVGLIGSHIAKQPAEIKSVPSPDNSNRVVFK